MAKIPREVKRAYRYLDVNYNASIEEVKTRARILTKVYRVKNIKSGKMKINKIKKINLKRRSYYENTIYRNRKYRLYF